MENRMKMTGTLRAWMIHKLKGYTKEEVLKQEHFEIKPYTAVPQKVTAKAILHAGREYSPAIVQQRLSYQLMDAVVDNGYVKFYSEEYPGGMEHVIGSRFLPNWLFCPWCGHKFRRKRQEIAYDELMKMLRRVQEET